MTSGPISESGIYTPTWIAVASFVAMVYVSIDCIKWLAWMFRDAFAPVDMAKRRLQSDKAIDAHIENCFNQDEKRELRKLRMSWVTWNDCHETEFQSLLTEELLGHLTMDKHDRLDALTLARKFKKDL